MFSSIFRLNSARKLSQTSFPMYTTSPYRLLASPFSSANQSAASERKKKIYVIVESPAKARTLSKFLPSNYIVDSCVGHIRDLGKKTTLPLKYSSQYVIPELNLSVADVGIDVDDDFKPLYQPIESKVSLISKMKLTMKNCDEILLATDEDREGEAISWHLLELLKPTIPVRRAVFHEITEKAILDSFASPRDLNYDIVASQEARRILDRLVGFTLSPILWKFVGPNLSAGRVQSCGLYMCVEKEKRRWNFIPSNYYSLKASFSTPSASILSGRLVSWNGKRIATVEDFDPSTGDLKLNKNSKTVILDENQTQEIAHWLQSPETKFIVDHLEKKKILRNPPAAFTTSTLQQECSSQLKLSPMETMSLAQSLYENSHITYMRTDSATLGQSAQNIAISMIENQFSKQYLHPQHSSSSSSSSTEGGEDTGEIPNTTSGSGSSQKKQQQQLNAQEAHEAIRPTTKLISFSNGTQKELFIEPNATGLVGLEKKLYELIYQRTLASVMAPAVFETSTLNIHGKSSDREGIFKANERKLLFPGYQIISNINSFIPQEAPSFPSPSPSSPPSLPQVGESLILSSNKFTDPEENQEENSEEFFNEVNATATVVTSTTTTSTPEGDGHDTSAGVGTSGHGIMITSHKTAPPLRFTEASFIRELETVGVGRPSTYASIIQTLVERGYLLVDKRTLIPTVKGIVVSNLLSKYFPEIILPEFTSKMETNLDLIAQGKLNRTKYLKSFYLGERQTSILNPTQAPLGLKEKAIEVNNERNRLSSMVTATAAVAAGGAGGGVEEGAYDYKILEIKTLKKYGRLFYTGDGELILEKEIPSRTPSTLSSSTDPSASASAADVAMDSIPELRMKIQRWKLSIGDDLRKLNEEYLEEVQQRDCEGADYCPSIIPPLQLRNHDRSRGKFLGRWMEKDIFLREGRFGPYLDHQGFFCSVGGKKSATASISLQDAISLLEQKMKKIELTKSSKG